MAYTTFSEIESGRAEVSDVISRYQAELNDWKTQAGRIASALTAAGGQYGGVVTGINALLAATPADQTLINKKGEIDKHLADFTALQLEASALDQLVNS